MFAGLLCSNHVTYRFGKGMMPKAYRLSMNSMALIMDNYAKFVLSLFFLMKRRVNVLFFFSPSDSQLAEQYGSDVASEILARS